jgi:hypothetical protein
MAKTYQIIFSFMALSILAATAFLTMLLILPPESQPVNATAMDFSAGRAMQDLEVIAREPHPMGSSQAHATVRDYLLEQIRALDLEPQVQKTFGIRLVHPTWIIAGAVENILVRIPGSDPNGGILLMAHYDSAPGVPGALDNGSGVVMILELIRALQAGPPLRQDILFFLTDGEEPGTIGAHAFVSQHPWFDDISLVINMDTFKDGPPMLFRTSPGNGVLIQALAHTSPRPGYVSLPFHLFPGGDSDLLPFLQLDVLAADFGTYSSFPELHTPQDRIEAVNLASIQLAGDQLLELIRYLGDQSMLDLNAPDETYFPVLGILVHYQSGWAWFIALVAGLCFLGTIYYGYHKRMLTWRGLASGFLALVLSLVGSVVIANLLWLGIQSLHPEYGYSSLRVHLSDDWLYAVGFIMMTLAVSTISIAVVRKKVTSFDLVAGALIFWFPVAIVVAVFVPATSYLSSWGLLAGSLALYLTLIVKPKKNAWMWSGIGFLMSAILVTFLWVPVVYQSFMGSGFPLLSMVVGLAALWLGFMLPILDWITTPNRWIFPLASLLLCVSLLFAGHFLVGKHSPPKLVNPIGYWLDASNSEAHWIAFSDELDDRQTDLLMDPLQRPYTEIFSEAPRYSIQTSEAPLMDMEGPYLEIVDDAWVNNRRVIRARLTTSMHDRLYVIIPRDVGVLAITIPHNERTELSPCDETFMLRFDGMPVEGFEMEFELDASGSFKILLVEERTGLPSFPGLSTQPQPGTMRTPGEFVQGIPTDFTAINRDFDIQGLFSD